jgi:hypothetical protein
VVRHAFLFPMNDEEFDRLMKKYEKQIEEGHDLTHKMLEEIRQADERRRQRERWNFEKIRKFLRSKVDRF